MTYEEVIRQIETYGAGWFVEKEWLKTYKKKI
ncbi:hypothetical protein N475_07130 [Pseudoalteromonas luteoviolacea DSM 6061]|uniref:Uncharacterized protein n=1 Tax=Pseudoalteromonas luteoviolacea DSM 6061 TaxID=1365250 RepID=A0A162AAP4_9GAMM|nr:hypothetical protein N475_07130 [Pseudoalteromonas luteoviolacea DSM 6061]